MLTKVILNTLGWPLAKCPTFVLQLICIFLGDIIYFLPTKRRHKLLSNFHHVFPERSTAWRKKIARRSCHRMVEMSLFVLASPHFSVEALRKRFQLDKAFGKKLEEQHKSEQPAMLLVPHFSLMESLTLIPALTESIPDVAIGTIFRPLNQASLNAWVKQTRERFGVELLSRKKGFGEALDILKEKGFLAVLFDQNAGSIGSLTTFFGRVASTTTLPGLLASKFNCRTGILYTERTGFWRGKIHTHQFLKQLKRYEITFQANQWLEQQLSNNESSCSDWLWLHDRWRHQDDPRKRFCLYSGKDLLEETAAFYKWDALPKKTRYWIRMPNWLGDIIMAIPLIKALRLSRPDAELTLLSQKHFIPLLEKFDIAERYIALPRKQAAFIYFHKIRRLSKQYPDTHILFTNSTRGDLEARCIGAPQRFGIERAGKKRKSLSHAWPMPDDLNEAEIHQTKLWEQYFKYFGLRQELDYTPLIGCCQGIQQQPKRIGLICSTENNPEKRWPVDKWRQLIKTCKGFEFHLYGTTRDKAICAEVAKDFPEDKVKDLSGSTDLIGFAEALASCKMIVCNDTGGMHLANAIGIPVIIIFGPTNPVRTGPIFNSPAFIIQPPDCAKTGGSDINKVTVEAVEVAIHKVLA